MGGGFFYLLLAVGWSHIGRIEREAIEKMMVFSGGLT